MNRQDPPFNFRHLRAFREVAGTHSISAAAQRIFLSQPAITQAIAKIERALATDLFERHTEGMFLTREGSLFLDRVERALEQLRIGAIEAARAGGRRGGRKKSHFDQLFTGTQLRALVAVSMSRNFSLAARDIGISQPSLHRAARDLEQLLEIPLFEKTSHGIVLTRAGNRLAQHARLAFAELDQGRAEVSALRGLDTGKIVIGSMPLARSFILPTAIGALMADRPEMAIDVIDGPYSDLLHGLRHGEIDMLIGALRIPPPVNDIVQEALFEDTLAVVAGRDHPLARCRRIDLRDTLNYPWVVPRRGAPTRDHFDALIGASGVGTPSGLIESSSLILIRGLLQNSQRLTLISEHQIRHEGDMALVALPVNMAHIRRPIGLTIRKNWRPTATQAEFMERLRDAAHRRD